MTQSNTNGHNLTQNGAAQDAALRLLFERSPDAVLLLDGEKFIDCNAAAVEMLQAADKEQVVGLHLAQLSPETQPDGSQSADKAESLMQAAFEQGSRRCEWLCRRTDDELLPVEITLTAVPWAGQQVLYVEIRDLGEIRQSFINQEKMLSTVQPNGDSLSLAKAASGRPVSGLKHDYVLDSVEGIENVSLPDLIDLENLQQIQDTFAVATGVASIITDLDGIPITTASNFSAVCEMVRSTEKGQAQCFKSDKVLGEQASKTLKPTVQECLSCGFADASAPIIVGGRHIANWLIGQANVMGAGEERIAEYAREIGADESEMVEAYENIPGMPMEQFEKILQLLWHFAREISTAGYNILALEQDIARRESAEAELTRLSAILGETSDLVSISTPTGELTYMNQAGRQLLGWDANEDVSQYIIPDIHPEWVQKLVAEEGLPTAVQEGIWQGETAVLHRDGHEIPVSQVIIVHRSADGEIEYMSTIMRDISEQKASAQQAQESLERRERQVALSTEISQEISAAESLDDLFQQVVNLVQERFGYYHAHVYSIDGEALVMQEGTGDAGQQMKESGHQIDLAAEQSLVARAARSGQPVLVPNVTEEPGWLPNPLLPETKAEIAVPIKLQEQVLGVLDVQNDAVGSLNEEDQLLLQGLCGQIAVAISQREAEEAQQVLTETLEREHTTLEAILEGLPLGVFVVEAPSGRPLITNSGAAELLGQGIDPNVEKDELADVYQAYRYGTDELYPPEQMPLVRGMAGESATVEDMEIRKPNGERHLLRVFGAPIKNSEGEITSSVAIFQDITEQKEAEQALAKQAEELQTVAEVSTRVATTRDADELLQEVVDLTKERFGLYHAHIYLLNEAGDTLELAAGAGEAGRTMVSEGWSIPYEREHSLVAQAAQRREGVIVNDVRANPDFMANPLLPDTRSEMAIPMVVGDKLVGVLDVQADITDRFTGQDVQIKTTLASQVAVALENARQYQQAQQQAAIIESAEVLMGAADTQGNTIFLNRKGLEMLGYTEADNVAGKPIIEFTAPDQRRRFEEVVLPQLFSEGSWQGETAFITKDGREFPVDQTIFLVRDDAGDVQLVATSVTDITARKELLEETTQQAERLTRLNEMSTALNQAQSLEEVYQIAGQYTQAILGGDRASLGLVDPDGQTFEIFGLSGLKEVIPMGVHLPVEGTGVGLAIRENRLTAFPQEAPLDTYKDTGKLAADGIQCTISAPLEVSGQVIGTLNIASKTANAFGNREISLMKQVTNLVTSAVQVRQLVEQMIASEARFRDVALSSGDWVWEVDANGVYTYCSDRVLDVLGYTPEEVVGKTPFDFMVPDEVERMGKHFGELIAAHKPIEELANRNLTKDGREVVLATSGVPILDSDGKLLGYRGIDQDITERKEAEEALAKQAEELQTVAEVSTRIATTRDADKLLQEVVDLTKERFGLYHAHIYLLNEAGDTLELAAGAGEAGRTMVSQGWSIPYEREHSLVAQTARRREGVIVNDVRTNPDFMANPLLPDTRAEMAVPLVVGERLLGVLDVQADITDRFTEQDVQIKTTLASQVGVALQNAQLLTNVQKQADELALVAEVSTQTGQIRDLQTLVDKVAEQTANGFDLYHMHIYLLDEQMNTLRLVAGAGRQPCKHRRTGYSVNVDIVDNRLTEVAKTRRAIVDNDVVSRPGFKPDPNLPDSRAIMIIPMLAGESLVGVVEVHGDRVNRFSRQDVQIKTILAEQLATAVRNVQLFAETQAALAEVEATQRRYTVQAWDSYHSKQKTQRYEQAQADAPPANGQLSGVIEQAITQKKAAVAVSNSQDAAAGQLSTLVAPLKVRNQVVGVLGLQELANEQGWSNEEIAMVEAIAQQMSQAAENMRLLDESQQRAAREQRVNEIGEKIRAAQSLEEALQIAVKEVGVSLKAPATIKLEVE